MFFPVRKNDFEMMGVQKKILEGVFLVSNLTQWWFVVRKLVVKSYQYNINIIYIYMNAATFSKI